MSAAVGKAEPPDLCGYVKREGYRPRAAHKLIEINEKYRIRKPGMWVSISVSRAR
jgi:hypothetical protein